MSNINFKDPNEHSSIRAVYHASLAVESCGSGAPVIKAAEKLQEVTSEVRSLVHHAMLLRAALAVMVVTHSGRSTNIDSLMEIVRELNAKPRFNRDPISLALGAATLALASTLDLEGIV